MEEFKVKISPSDFPPEEKEHRLGETLELLLCAKKRGQEQKETDEENKGN